MSIIVLVLALCAAALVYYTTTALSRTRSRLPLPPGPEGNWDFGRSTSSFAHVSFQELETLFQEYGPVVTLKSGSKTVVVIGRQQAASDIMEKEGASLADRPKWVAASEIVSGGMRILLLNSGKRFRKLRRALHSHLQAKAVVDYEPLQMRYAKNVILDLIDDPDNHACHARRYAGSLILALTYGRTAPGRSDDPEIVAVARCLQRVGLAVRPGEYKVDEYPLLRYWPFYRKELRVWHAEELALFRSQMDTVANNMDTVQPCFGKYLLEHQGELELKYDELVYLAGTMFGAGSATTASAISLVIMAAACFPAAQRAVQQQIDEVIGGDRAPNFEDYAALPRVKAFILETYRWRPVGGSGFSHRASRDVFWKNYCIPKGTVVIGNHWSICRDPALFEDSDDFNPDRWLDDLGRIKDDVPFFNFGFGRRICPGQYVADKSLFINTALILWAFNITQVASEPIDPTSFVSVGVSISPQPFKACFNKRVEGIHRLLEGYGISH
ncbi:cytochrome P450 [Guyanagaster necrorhizus]|uniref:Cytochrome P450 n=1 Tax=Guyanagaster necrorhizus TaxID=856835 RepID=A0A9P7VFG5_9AGAR|nr:cytochrome P450 [Guyanagaster necrorhizus MCA 3950]KAG7439963.1 cytochrome P450 [Guyanagaster necrorhizus MCA 3950]